MTIRYRTEGSGVGRAAGLASAAGLAGAAVLHGLWATGSTWPARDPEDLADLVVGQAPFPGVGATIAVAGLLTSASVLTATASGVVPVGPHLRRLARLGASVVSGVLLVRGTGGVVVSALGVGGASERFRRMDLRVYSPLCLGLGSLVAVSSRAR